MSLKTRFSNLQDVNDHTVNQVCQLVNKVYDEAEKGLWQGTDSRSTSAEISTLLKEKKLILAEWKNVIVGCVNVQKLDAETAEFGMLAVDKTYRNFKIGSALVKAVEQWAKEQGCKFLRLELLTPKNWKHPSKEFLKEWYTRIGYIPKHTEPFENMYSHRVEHLATECDFTVWIKPL